MNRCQILKTGVPGITAAVEEVISKRVRDQLSSRNPLGILVCDGIGTCEKEDRSDRSIRWNVGDKRYHHPKAGK